MPLSGATAGKTRVYSAVPPRKEQRRFPQPRRTIKRAAPSLPALTKRQSTLTQLDFSTASPSASRTTIPTSSDDGDFEEPPRKKRRKSKFHDRDDNQSTMTQFDRGDLPMSGRMCASHGPKKKAMDVWEEYIPQEWEQRNLKHEMQDNTEPCSSLRNGGGDDHGAKPDEILETSQAAYVPSPPKKLNGKAGATGGRDEACTPRKVNTRTEVPSSQTPPSTKSSFRSVRFADDLLRSPLKERAGNAQVHRIVLSPESQNTSMKMLERVRLESRKVPALNATSGNAMAPQKSKSSQASPEKLIIKAPLHEQNLERGKRVQDSKGEDFEMFESSPKATPKQRPRKLRRTATVQDSQVEDLDLESPGHYSVQVGDHSYGNQDVEESQWIHDDCGPATFDPAYLALDRDAARFGQTQTQLSAVHEEHEDSETDVESHLCVPSPANNGQVHQCSRAITQDEQSTPMLKATAKETFLEKSAASRNDDDIDPPSSPPNLRLSQISTVSPTQTSPPKSNSIALDLQATNSETQIPPSSSCSPRKLFSGSMSETIPSSPLPLPPSSFGRGKYTAIESTSGTPLDSLEDFSLPPPPPLSSSRRR